MIIFFRWILPIATVLIGMYLQLNSSADPKSIALARSGCLLVLFGVLIESKYVLRIIGDDVYTGAGNLIVSQPPEATTLKDKINRAIHHIGLVWVVIGTLLWGFGDTI